MLSIINYGVGNLGSLVNIHKRLGVEFNIASTPEEILESTHLILPGVGSFDAAIENLNKSGMRPALEDAVLLQKKPILGICLGMQIMAACSEEGQREGLGWIDATVKKIPRKYNLKVPHVGWNRVEVTAQNPLLCADHFNRFYFLHSYHVECKAAGLEVARVRYGEAFTCAFSHENIFGVQFHPEKSHNFGKQLLRRFSEI